MRSLLLFVLLTTCPALAWVGSEVDFPGDAQGWTLDTDSVQYTGPDGSTEWFRFEFTAPATDADYRWKMVVGNDWNQDFGGNAAFRKDQTDTLFYQPLGDTAAKLEGGITAGRIYRFQVKDPGLADSFPAVMELSSAPVGITSVARDAGSGLITVSLSAAPAPEEKVYLRYSADGFATSGFHKATLGGATATAILPDLREGATYEWYAFTSTATPDRFHNGYSTDALTLAWDNNGGANYAFTTPSQFTSVMVNGVPSNYTTTKFFLDEIDGEVFALDVVAVISGPVDAAQVVTNLNNRDRAELDADSDGLPDGIVPPARDLATPGGPHYYQAHTLTGSGGTFTASLPVSKTGTYRLTVRYRTSPGGPWYYLNARDHAIVVSPRKTLDMTLYELNALTVEATGANQGGRSTFQDLLSAAEGDTDGFDPFNLDYLNLIQANALWFQPIHPTGADGVETDPGTGSPYVPGSPYATKDFFAVNGYHGSDGTEATAMAEFQNFVAKCDAYSGTVGPIHVMLDYVANHSAWDAVYGQGGVDLGLTADPDEKIPASYYSQEDDYGIQATRYSSAADTDIARAPDRFDFGKWDDVAELFYGRYSALQRYDDGSNAHNNEDDYFEFASLAPETVELWELIAYYPEFWLEKTGHSLVNSTSEIPEARRLADDRGLDALRCDFGQGLPNPLWEYIINRTRARKWNFVFMAETLDGGNPGYRSNRVFDILNESMVFNYTATQENNESNFESQQESRRSTYRTGAILHNLTSHDEIMPDNDPWVTATRYGMVGTLHGLPMVFYGQEQGIQRQNNANPDWDGFALHELNFGKLVPHFKKWNELRVWASPPPFSTGMDQWYGRVNGARLNSPALRGLDQYYLGAKSGGTHEQLWAIAKSERSGTSPAFADVVLGFANLFVHGGAHASQSNVFDLAGPWAFLGMEGARSYNVRNLASGDASALLWGTPRTGQDLFDNGIFVSLGGGTNNPITDDGELVQYLKVVDVTPPPAPDPVPPAFYILGGTDVAFSWTPNGTAHDNITHYLIDIGTTHGGDEVESGVSVPFGTNSHTFTGVPGTAYYATITAVSAVGIASSAPGSSDPGTPSPGSSTTSVILLDPAGDEDDDGQDNAFEDTAGTNPLDAEDLLEICVTEISGGGAVEVTFDTVPGRIYTLQSRPNLVTGAWADEDEPESVDQIAAGTSMVFTDANAAGVRKFYRVEVERGAP